MIIYAPADSAYQWYEISPAVWKMVILGNLCELKGQGVILPTTAKNKSDPLTYEGHKYLPGSLSLKLLMKLHTYYLP